MGQVLHGSATTTEAVRRAIQHSQESLRALAKRYGINPKTVAKWRKRSSVADLRDRPEGAAARPCCRSRRRRSSSPSAGTRCCRWTTASTRLQATIPHLTRSSLHRCLQRHGISRLPEVEGDKPAKSGSRPTRSATSTSTSPRCAPKRASSTCSWRSTAPPSSPSSSCTRRSPAASRATSSGALIAAVPYKVHTVLTDNGTHFTDAQRQRLDRPCR